MQRPEGSPLRHLLRWKEVSGAGGRVPGGGGGGSEQSSVQCGPWKEERNARQGGVGGGAEAQEGLEATGGVGGTGQRCLRASEVREVMWGRVIQDHTRCHGTSQVLGDTGEHNREVPQLMEKQMRGSQEDVV